MNFPSILIIIVVGVCLVFAIRYLASGKGRFSCDRQCKECSFAQKCTAVEQADQNKKKTNC